LHKKILVDRSREMLLYGTLISSSEASWKKALTGGIVDVVALPDDALGATAECH
jgi:hypothetical protein